MKGAIAIFQVVLVGVYFLIYYFWNVHAALAFALFFVISDILAWKKALKLYNKDDNFIYLSITILTSMLAIIFMFANAYEISNLIEHKNKTITGLWEHVYFSTVTFTTLGYGDYVPTGIARLIAALQALMGFGYFAFIIGVVGSIFYSRIEK